LKDWYLKRKIYGHRQIHDLQKIASIKGRGGYSHFISLSLSLSLSHTHTHISLLVVESIADSLLTEDVQML
jgi:hypothetical protein